MTVQKLRIFSFGGGVQSMAVAILQAYNQLKEPFDYFVFANVGDNAESPDTLNYINNIVKPFFVKHNMSLVEVRKTNRAGESVDLYDYTMDTSKKGVQIPVVMKDKGFAQRKCTQDWKIAPVTKWIKNHIRDNPERYEDSVTVDIGIGFSSDEIRRRKKRIEGLHYGKGVTKTKFLKQYVYPLLDDALYSRDECLALFPQHDIDTAPRSACFFCPFHSRAAWDDLRHYHSDLYDKAVLLEGVVREKMDYYNLDSYLHRDTILLKDIPDHLGTYEKYMDTDESGCSSGYCGL